MIASIIMRCRRIAGLHEIICAIPSSESNDKLAKEASDYALIYRGSENDVLGRYWAAAQWAGADIVMRITADCPLLCPDLCATVLENLGTSDYCSNIEPRTFPQGFDCEVFTISTLAQADREDKEREHVTTWMRRSPKVKRANVCSPWVLEGRCTLDTEEDYKVICAGLGHEAYKRLRAACCGRHSLRAAPGAR